MQKDPVELIVVGGFLLGIFIAFVVWPIIRFFRRPNQAHFAIGGGIKHFGHSERLGDGSYMTTAWLVVAFIPIIPLRSHRIRFLKTRQVGHDSYEEFEIVEKVRLRLSSVALVYLSTVSYLAYLFFCLLGAAKLVGVYPNMPMAIMLLLVLPGVAVTIWPFIVGRLLLDRWRSR
jgi:hypothetical protein